MNIIIYGCGFYGEKALKAVRKFENINVLGFADSYKKGSVYGLPIIDLFEWSQRNSLDDVYIIIAIANFGGPVKIYWRLKEQGYKHIYYYLHKDYTSSRNFLLGECLNMGKITKDTLPYLEMHIMDNCNLNCRGCTHFSALYESRIPNTVERLNDVKKIRKLFRHIFVFSLLGGEPFLNPELCTYISEVRKLLPETEIQVVTNGLCLTKENDRIYECIKENHVTLCISEYKPTTKILGPILEKIRKFDIDYSIRSYDIKKRFNKPLSLSKKSIHPHKCISDGCVEICDGKIARCPTLLFVPKLNEKFCVGLPEEGIRNIDELTSAREVLEYLNKPIPLCKHCVENEIEWATCHQPAKLEDFVEYE